MAEVVWTYGCPHEGTHFIDPNELVVLVTDRETAWVVAVVPPLPTTPPSQNEAMAKVICEALAWEDWTQLNGLADWCSAHGFVTKWPAVAALAIAPADDPDIGG